MGTPYWTTFHKCKKEQGIYLDLLKYRLDFIKEFSYLQFSKLMLLTYTVEKETEARWFLVKKEVKDIFS